MDTLFESLKVGSLIYWGLILFGSGVVLFGGGFFGVCMTMVYRLHKRTAGCNCLIWRHPDNTAEAVDKLELQKVYLDEEKYIGMYFFNHKWERKMEKYEPRPKRLFRKARESRLDFYNARLKIAQEAFAEQRREYLHNAPDWDYKEAWWQWWRVTVKWVYETNNGKDYEVKALDPDKIIDSYKEKGYPILTSLELGEDIECSKNWGIIYQKTMKWLQALALGAPVLLGVSFIFGIIILGVFLMG